MHSRGPRIHIITRNGHGFPQFWALLTALVIIIPIASCRAKDPVVVLLDDLKSGAEAHKLGVFEDRLAPSFMGHGGIDRGETLATLRRYFAAYKKINLQFDNIERSPAGDRVYLRVNFSGEGQSLFGLQNVLPPSAVYRFELGLVREGGSLKVNRASWVDASSEQR